MTNNNAIATTKMNTGAPPLMAKLSLFPVSKPNASIHKRTNGRETVRITPSRPEEWVYGKTPRLIFLYVQSMIRMKNNPDVDQDTHTVVFRGSFQEFCDNTGISNHSGCQKETEDTLMNLARTSISIMNTDENREKKANARRSPSPEKAVHSSGQNRTSSHQSSSPTRCGPSCRSQASHSAWMSSRVWANRRGRWTSIYG